MHLTTRSLLTALLLLCAACHVVGQGVAIQIAAGSHPNGQNNRKLLLRSDPKELAYAPCPAYVQASPFFDSRDPCVLNHLTAWAGLHTPVCNSFHRFTCKNVGKYGKATERTQAVRQQATTLTTYLVPCTTPEQLSEEIAVECANALHNPNQRSCYEYTPDGKEYHLLPPHTPCESNTAPPTPPLDHLPGAWFLAANTSAASTGPASQPSTESETATGTSAEGSSTGSATEEVETPSEAAPAGSSSTAVRGATAATAADCGSLQIAVMLDYPAEVVNDTAVMSRASTFFSSLRRQSKDMPVIGFTSPANMAQCELLGGGWNVQCRSVAMNLEALPEHGFKAVHGIRDFWQFAVQGEMERPAEAEGGAGSSGPNLLLAHLAVAWATDPGPVFAAKCAQGYDVVVQHDALPQEEVPPSDWHLRSKLLYLRSTTFVRGIVRCMTDYVADVLEDPLKVVEREMKDAWNMVHHHRIQKYQLRKELLKDVYKAVFDTNVLNDCTRNALTGETRMRYSIRHLRHGVLQMIFNAHTESDVLPVDYPVPLPINPGKEEEGYLVEVYDLVYDYEPLFDVIKLDAFDPRNFEGYEPWLPLSADDYALWEKEQVVRRPIMEKCAQLWHKFKKEECMGKQQQVLAARRHKENAVKRIQKGVKGKGVALGEEDMLAARVELLTRGKVEKVVNGSDPDAYEMSLKSERGSVFVFNQTFYNRLAAPNVTFDGTA